MSKVREINVKGSHLIHVDSLSLEPAKGMDFLIAGFERGDSDVDVLMHQGSRWRKERGETSSHGPINSAR